MIRIAVAGLGFMGATHVRAMRDVPGAQLAAIVSCDEEKLSGNLSKVGGNFGIAGESFDFSGIKKFRDVRAALEDPEIDAIDICFPTDQHFALAMAALRAGKHVLVEKPLALDGDDADMLVDEARRRGLILMTGHLLRFIPEYAALAEALSQGHLGHVRSAFFRRRCAAPTWSRWLPDPERSGGAVLDLLIHDIDFCLYLFGKPTAVSGLGSADPVIGFDWSEARLDYPGMGPVIITGGWYHPKSYPFSMEFTVLSDAGTLEFASSGGSLTLYDASGSAGSLPVGSEDPFVSEIGYFADCAGNRTWPDRCPPEDSALAVRVARWLLDSRERGGKPVECR